MSSSIKINHISYRVVPLIQNGNSFAIQNKPLKVEPISSTNTNIGYNPNNPNSKNGIIKSESYNNNDNFEDIFKNELAKIKGLGK